MTGHLTRSQVFWASALGGADVYSLTFKISRGTDEYLTVMAVLGHCINCSNLLVRNAFRESTEVKPALLVGVTRDVRVARLGSICAMTDCKSTGLLIMVEQLCT